MKIINGDERGKAIIEIEAILKEKGYDLDEKELVLRDVLRRIEVQRQRLNANDLTEHLVENMPFGSILKRFKKHDEGET